jgi:hypothetical protein
MNIKHEPVVDFYELEETLCKSMDVNPGKLDLMRRFFQMVEDGSYHILKFDEDAIEEAQQDYVYELKHSPADSNTKFLIDYSMKVFILKHLRALFPSYGYFLVKVYW